jgi:hypothetical protein
MFPLARLDPSRPTGLPGTDNRCCHRTNRHHHRLRAENSGSERRGWATVLLRVYAECIDGWEETVRRRCALENAGAQTELIRDLLTGDGIVATLVTITYPPNMKLDAEIRVRIVRDEIERLRNNDTDDLEVMRRIRRCPRA